mgnify:CR=1 FL=1
MNEIQQKILDIFIEIDKVCVKHNLRYYAIGGTCLGAVRHKGFISWDDDIDIAMPDKDFKKFMVAAQKELPESLALITLESTEHRGFLCAKVHDVNTTFIESHMKEYKEEYSGIFVDIMPLYGIPENKVKKKLFISIVVMLLKLNYKRQLAYSKRWSVAGKMLWITMRPVNCMVHYDFYIKIWKKLVEKYDFDAARYTGYLWSTKIREKDLIFEKAWFDHYVELPFENIKMRCPCNWNEYLIKQFGDYMQLPPEDQRTNHGNGAIIDLYQSYKVYQQEMPN